MNRLRSLALVCFLLGAASGAHAADGYGKLTGIVADGTGNPQLGATVWLTSEATGGRTALQLLTDQNGVFTGQRLRPGLYSVKATLAGFLPAIQQHVTVGANVTTLVRLEMDSVFASLDTLRRSASQPSESDDWRWVLRTSSSTRPVLQFSDGTVVMANDSNSALGDFGEPKPEAHARVEMTSGSSAPGSSSSRSGRLATTASYDQSLGGAGKLLLAGRVQYPGMFEDSSLGGAVATVWLPGGNAAEGPETTVVLRQVRLQPQQATSVVRAMRLEHTERMMIGDQVSAEYGLEYLMGGIAGAMTSTARPHARLTMNVAPSWSLSASLQTNPDSEGLWVRGSNLESAIGALDTLPVMVWHNGRQSLEGGWHEELAARHTLGKRTSVEASAFHDYSGHEAVFAIDSGSPSPAGFFGTPWAHDAGGSGSWGTRVVYREKIADNLEVAAIYTWAGALGLTGTPVGEDLNRSVSMSYRNSVAARVSAKVPKFKTDVSASYKWLQGPAVSRQDLFGEAALGVDPNLSLTIRQPLPASFAGGHWEVLADFRNVLAQGYVPAESQGGQLVFMPVERSFRGGVSVQF